MQCQDKYTRCADGGKAKLRNRLSRAPIHRPACCYAMEGASLCDEQPNMEVESANATEQHVAPVAAQSGESNQAEPVAGARPASANSRPRSGVQPQPASEARRASASSRPRSGVQPQPAAEVRPASASSRPRSGVQPQPAAEVRPASASSRPRSGVQPSAEPQRESDYPEPAEPPVNVQNDDSVAQDPSEAVQALTEVVPDTHNTPMEQPTAPDTEVDSETKRKNKREKPSIFRKFDSHSYKKMIQDEIERAKIAEEERKKREEDEKFLDEDQKTKDDDTKVNADEMFDPDLEDGENLPRRYLKQLPPGYAYTPLEEIDEEVRNHERTFIVISRRLFKPVVNRFSATSSLFIFPPWNPLRKAMLVGTCSEIVEYFVLCTVIINSIFMAANNFGWTTNIPEYVFISIYAAEWIMKMIAMGFVLNPYSYLRNGWNILDFAILVLSAITMIVTAVVSSSSVNLSGLRTLRVFRLLRSFSLIRGLRSIVTALLLSLKSLLQVIAVLIVYVFFTGLLAMEISQGMTHNWCVANIVYPTTFTFTTAQIDSYWYSWVYNSSNYGGIRDRMSYTSCNNLSYSATCTDLSGGNNAYTCITARYGSPAVFGYMSYDNMGYNMLSAFQLATLDHWHNQYYYLMRSNSYLTILFYLPFVSFGSYYIINIILSVLVVAFEEETDFLRTRKKKLKLKWVERQAEKAEKAEAKRPVTQDVDADADDADAIEKAENDVINQDARETTEDPQETTVAQTEEKPLKSAMKKKGDQPEGETADKPDAANEHRKLGFDEKATAVDDNFDVRTLNSATTGDWTSTTASSDVDSIGESSTISGEVIVLGDGNRDVIDRNCLCCKKAYQNSTTESSQTCYVNWLKAQNAVYRFICDPLTEVIIMFVIIINIAIMTLSWPNQDPNLINAFNIVNIVCSCVYFLEAILKIFAMCLNYFKSGWNIFDLIIVIFTILDLALTSISGFGIIKAFRLLRVFRLINQFQSMKEVLVVVLKSAANIGLLTAILGIMMYIFAIIGMELFGNSYVASSFSTNYFMPYYPTDTGLPKWHFLDIGHSLMQIVRILCGDMFFSLYDAWYAAGPVVFVVYIPCVLICNFVFRNLFLALLLLIFRKPVPKSEHISKFTLAWERVKQLCCCCCSPKRNAVGDSSLLESQAEQGDQNSGSQVQLIADDKAETVEGVNTGSQPNVLPSVTIVNEVRPTRRRSSSSLHKPSKTNAESDASSSKALTTLMEESEEKHVPDCCCGCYYKCCCKVLTCPTTTRYGHGWLKFRVAVQFVTTSKAFEAIIILAILVSSIELCMEDIYLVENPTLQSQLNIVTMVTVAIFVVEMFLVLIAEGWKEYFTTAWTILDFIIVVISVIDVGLTLANAPTVSVLTTLRALRALRPLRFIGKIESMKILVASLLGGIGQILSAAFVTLLFWFIFCIIGVQLFQSQFWMCVDMSRTWVLARLPHSTVANLSQCMQNSNYVWMNAYVNFDHVAAAFVALLQVATTQGWIEVMNQATDMTSTTGQPLTDNSPWYYFYFVAFMVIGVFFSLNIFVGVLAQNFSKYRKQLRGEHHDMLVNDQQRRFVLMFRHLSRISPPKPTPIPKQEWRKALYDVSMSKRFDMFILFCIIINCIVLATSYYNDQQVHEDMINAISQVFYGIFIMEAVIKIIGLGRHYFLNWWNIYDFSLVIINALFQALQTYYWSQLNGIGAFSRILRLVRCVRVLSAMPSAHGIRKMITAYILSLPAMINIFILMILVVFIYSIIGMQLYGFVQVGKYSYFDEFVNFRTFLFSFMMLFRASTNSGWDQIMSSLMVRPPFCNSTAATLPDGFVHVVENGNCGDPLSAQLYMCTFVIITKIIILNLYTVVILDNYIQATELNRTGITEFDITTFFETWAKFDPMWTQFVKARDVNELCSELEEPLRMPQPNKDAVAQLKIPIRQGERIHCMDLLRCIVIKKFGQSEYEEDIATATKEDPFVDFLNQVDETFRKKWKGLKVKQIDTNYNRWRRLRAIRVIQRVWKKYTIKQRFVGNNS